MTRPLSVLLVEDSEADAELLVVELRRAGFDTAFERVATGSELRVALASGAWQIVVCDHGLPNFSSTEALRVVRETGLDIPFVILSGTIGEEAAIEALKAGARDVVLKTNLARLGPVVDRELREAENREHLECERAELQTSLRHQAVHDALTGLPNRLLALDRARQMLARARRQPFTVAALYVDLDGFKQVNDGFGHAAGDELLRLIAGRLASAIRDSDTAARLSGDEFVVLIDVAPLDGGPELVAERILEVLRQPFDLTAEIGRQLTVTASIGIAMGEPETAEELLRDADVALYEAKRAGRNRFVFFESAMQTEAHDRLTVKMDLAEALDHDELFLLYQPTFDLQTEHAISTEALIRWRHPDRGIVAPDQFIPIAEKSDLIVPIGRWVLEEACQQAATWHANQHPLGMSVNVSARQLDRDEFIDDVRSALDHSALEPTMLTLELTETTLMRDADATATRLDALKALGVRIAIDDFGTGYSSLAYLSQFPVDALKIDRSFISGIASSTASAALVPTLIQLGKTLNIETVAEGIEAPAQLRALQREHCDHGQGYLLARPLAADAVEAFLYDASPTHTTTSPPFPAGQ
jgi:diguanylate cyclase (GGDEF)-like protein